MPGPHLFTYLARLAGNAAADFRLKANLYTRIPTQALPTRDGVLPRFSQTMRIPMSAGETPAMRAA